MEIEIPGGQIVDNDLELVVTDDPERIVTLLHMEQVHGFIAQGTQYQGEMIEVRLTADSSPFNGFALNSAAMLFDHPRPMLLVSVPRAYEGGGGAHTKRYVLFREEDAHAQMWSVSTKMLVLPEDHPEEWGDGDAGFEQEEGRLHIFVGLANINNWFKPVRISPPGPQ